MEFKVLSTAKSPAEADFIENWPIEVAVSYQLAELTVLKEMPRGGVYRTMYHYVEGWRAQEEAGTKPEKVVTPQS